MGAGLRGDSLETKLHGDLKKIIDGQQQLGDRVTAIEEGKVQPGGKVASTTPDMGELPPALPGVEIPTSRPAVARRAGARARATSTACRHRLPCRSVLSRRRPTRAARREDGRRHRRRDQQHPAELWQGWGKDGAGSGAKKTGRSFCRLVL
jgi:conjugal transfer pilus assembly protein TraB